MNKTENKNTNTKKPKEIRNKSTHKHPNSKNKIKTENKTPKIRTKQTENSTQSYRT